MENYDLKTDDELVILYNKGDKMAVQYLFDKYHSYLFKIAYNLIHNSDEAEDLLQDTYLKIIQNFKKYKTQNYFKQWIIKILKNNIINFYKKKKITTFDESKLFILNNIEDESESFDDIFIKDEILKIINETINSFKPDKKEIMDLKFKYNLKAKDIAVKLNMPLNTVLTSIHYSIIKIKDNLKEKGYL